MLTAFNIAKIANEAMTGFFLLLDGIVYWVIGILFDLYYSLAGAEIIKNSVYEEIANRIMVIIGVAMLFYLAYALLKALVNPDELTKSTQKIVINLVVSLVLIVIVPTIFTYAFRFQNIIMKDQVIDKIVFGNSTNTIASVGKATAMNFFSAFVEIGDTTSIDEYSNWESLQACILDNTLNGCKGSEGFRDLGLLKEVVVNGDAEYTPIVSTLCGVFLAYVIASFCLDLGLRVVKLAFYQIISPIPIMMRIIPEKKSVFDNWVKATIATYMEVFIRLFIIYIITFLCAKIFQDGVFSLGGESVNIFGKIIIVLGIMAFAKQAPKLIGDVIGVNSGNIKLGIREKLATGGAFAAGAILGGGATAFTRNAMNRYANKANWLNKNGRLTAGSILKNLGGGVFSSVAGGISGAARSGKAGWSAKNATDMKNAASTGTQNAIKARENRAAYKASHGGTMLGAMGGYIVDTAKNVGTWAGITAPLEQLKIEQANAQEVKSARKAVDDRLNSILEREKDKRVLSGGRAMNVAGVGAFRTLSDLRNEMEIMKSTGRTSSGRQVTSQMLTEMSKMEFELKKELKKEILSGYDKNGDRLTHNNFNEKYDKELKELVTAYRTKTLQHANVIAENISDDRGTQVSLENFKNQAIGNKGVDLDKFILDDINYNKYDANTGTIRTETGSMADILMNNANNSINDANANINTEVNQRIEKERQSQKK